jgi:hypothetical protein
MDSAERPDSQTGGGLPFFRCGATASYSAGAGAVLFKWVQGNER